MRNLSSLGAITYEILLVLIRSQLDQPALLQLVEIFDETVVGQIRPVEPAFRSRDSFSQYIAMETGREFNHTRIE